MLYETIGAGNWLIQESQTYQGPLLLAQGPDRRGRGDFNLRTV